MQQPNHQVAWSNTPFTRAAPIVITRMSSHPPTRAYVERRTAEGLSKTEIIRCLKRYVARQVYPHLRGAAD